MNLHITIMTYSGGAECCDLHMPFWKAHKPVKVEFITDVMDKHDFRPNEAHYAGLSQRVGGRAHLRLMVLMDLLAKRAVDGCDAFLVFEYDSLCLDPAIPSPCGFTGNCFHNPMDKYMAPRYALPPWYFDRKAVERMHKAFREWPGIYEGGVADRYLSALAWVAGVPILDHEPRGYAVDTIEERHLPAVETAIANGATMIHGIKTAEMLERIVKMHSNVVRAS